MPAKNKRRVPWYFISVVVLAVVFLVLFIWFIISKITLLNPDSELVQTLYSYIGTDRFDYCSGLPFYQDDIDKESLDESTKMCLAYKLIDSTKIFVDALEKTKKVQLCKFTNNKNFRVDEDSEQCSVIKFDKKELESAYYAIYGSEIEHQDFNLSGSLVCYFDSEESRYVCGSAEVQNLQLGWTPTIYRVIQKAKKKNNKIYLYDYYVSINKEKCFLDNEGNIENSECSDLIKKNLNLDEYFVSDYGQAYVHVFEKDNNGNYHWNSSSVITEK